MQEVEVKRETLTVVEAGKVLGLGRCAAYAAVARGEVPSIRIGGRVLVSRRALERTLDGQGVAGEEGAR